GYTLRAPHSAAGWSACRPLNHLLTLAPVRVAARATQPHLRRSAQTPALPRVPHIRAARDRPCSTPPLVNVPPSQRGAAYPHPEVAVRLRHRPPLSHPASEELGPHPPSRFQSVRFRATLPHPPSPATLPCPPIPLESPR